MTEQTKRLAHMWMTAQPVVAAFVASLVRDGNAQEDILQEVVAAVLESYDKYDATRPFVGWVLGIARNQVRLYRRRSLRGRVLFDESTLDFLMDSFSNVRTEEVLKLEFLPECLDRLNDHERHICELRYEQGLKPSGIAAVLEMTSNTVSKALQRIRSQLRDCIEFKVARARGTT